MRSRKIELIAISQLKPYSRNARTHTPAQIDQIAKSIITFGFTNPILVDKRDRTIAGYGRLLAAKQLRLEVVPVIRLEDLSEAEIRAYAIADNRLAEKAGWDKEILALELKDLASLDLGFDLELTGFDVGEIDMMVMSVDNFGGQHESDEAADREVDVDRDGAAVARAGDIFSLACHRLACGDSRDPKILDRLMAGSLAHVVVTDPPYNVPIEGFVSGKGRAKHREFAMASGEMTFEAFGTFLETSLSGLASVSEGSAIFYVFMDWRHVDQLVRAARAVGLRLLNICVWVKSRGGMGSFYRSQHELVGVFARSGVSFRNNIQLGRNGRNRTNVWHYSGPNALVAQGRAELALHPTVKPSALIADAILDSTPRGGIVLDPFAGSGTIFIAAEKTGRRAYGVEIDPHYVDAAVKRWQDYTGKTAVHLASGKSFEALRVERARTHIAATAPSSKRSRSKERSHS